MEILALDENDEVRKKAASNYNTPVDILLKLSQDANHYVRCGVARNYKTPRDILESLLLNQSDNIRQFREAKSGCEDVTYNLSTAIL